MLKPFSGLWRQANNIIVNIHVGSLDVKARKSTKKKFLSASSMVRALLPIGPTKELHESKSTCELICQATWKKMIVNLALSKKLIEDLH